MVSSKVRNGGLIVTLTVVVCVVITVWTPRHTPQVLTDYTLYTADGDADNGDAADADAVLSSQKLSEKSAQRDQAVDQSSNHKLLSILHQELQSYGHKISHPGGAHPADMSTSLPRVDANLIYTTSILYSSTTTESDSTDSTQNTRPTITHVTTPQLQLPPLNLTHFIMDFEKSDDIGAVLKQRRDNVYASCDRNIEEINDSILTYPRRYQALYRRDRGIYTLHDQKTSFCPVAKSGSTFWKSVFVYSATGEIVNGLAAPNVLGKGKGVRSFRGWDLAKKRGEQYVTFVAVRNPWKRLVSLYQQKIEAYLPQLIANGFTSVKKMAPYKYMLKVCDKRAGELVSFRDMLQCVLDTDIIDRSPNRHWMSAYEMCRICDYEYDYIIRVENMMNEGTYVLSAAGVTDADTILSTVREGTIRPVEKGKKQAHSEYWRDIPTYMIDKLRTLYKWEISLFDYPDTPFTD